METMKSQTGAALLDVDLFMLDPEAAMVGGEVAVCSCMWEHEALWQCPSAHTVLGSWLWYLSLTEPEQVHVWRSLGPVQVCEDVMEALRSVLVGARMAVAYRVEEVGALLLVVDGARVYVGEIEDIPPARLDGSGV